LNHLKLKHSQGVIAGNSAELKAVKLIIMRGPKRYVKKTKI
jgi:hypothetical protein